MEDNVIESEAEAACACGESLAVLQELQRAYQLRLDALEQLPKGVRLQRQVDLLRSWVSDLVGQNSLLAQTVEELETEATTRLFLEQRKHSEMVMELRAEAAVLRQQLVCKESDLRGLLEVLRQLRDFDHITLDRIKFFDVTKSDIFGHVEWPQKALAQGDSRDLKLTKTNRHRRNL